MIQMIGIRKNVEVHIREKLSILSGDLESTLKDMRKFCNEVVIISTCNRTEIYFTSDKQDQTMLEYVFKVLKWDNAYMEHVFYLKQQEVVKHLLEVSCGFHSKILGEDQILGQIKKAFEASQHAKMAGKYLSRLFQTAIVCSKHFRNKAKLHEIPISSSSIVIREAKKRNIKKYLILGYGEVGKLTAKYILDSDYDMLYIAVRNAGKVDITGPKICVVDFIDRADYYKEVECIISCTGAPDIVVNERELPAKNLLIFDLAVPRDVEQSITELSNIELYDIDKISAMHDETCLRRKALMESNRYLIAESVAKYMQWLEMDSLAPVISRMSDSANHISSERLKSFRNKMHTKDNLQLAETLIRSTSNAFLNRAIEILQDEHQNGRGEECLRIVKKMFQIEI